MSGRPPHELLAAAEQASSIVDLVPVRAASIGGDLVQTTNAREIHAYLGIGKDFSSWVKVQIARARLVENRDFVSSPSRGSSGQPIIEYHLTLDAGKHIAMLSETDRGFEVREYFIECERKARAAPAVPQTMAAALRLAADQAEQIEQQQAALAAAAPAVEFVDRYVDATGLTGFRQACKVLKIKENIFREFLLEKGIVYRLGRELAPRAEHLNAGRFEVKAGVSAKNEHAFNSMRFTPKGLSWVAGEFAKHQLAAQMHHH